jgi:two-component system, OmpR family, sensor histidine kinase KdpD
VTDENSSEAASTPVSGSTSERRGKQGRLKVFLGMAPGVGKTAAMLHAAEADKLAGRDVVIAIAEAHGVRAVESLAGRLPRVGRQPGNNMDLDEVVVRRPDIVVVDELARANSTEARHPKRFQDVLELLEAGMDVYTTLNVYEIASRADLLWPVAGAASHQIVPDSILDNAEIVLVDLPPSKLIRRLKHGQIRFPEGSGLEKSRLFEEDSLMALREMTARLFTERVARDAQEQRQTSNAGGPAKAGHRVLVAVEAGWDSEQLILWTRRLAGSLNASWIVLYVETSRSVPAEEESRLTRNLELARELGAEVITTADEDLADAVLRVAFSRNITQIVVGKTGPLPWWRMFPRDPTIARLIRGSGDIGVQVVPVNRGTPVRLLRRSLAGSGWLQYAVVVATVVLVAWAGYLFTPRVTEVGAHAMAFLSLLAVVVLALFVERGPALLAAALSAAIWDYFFLPPVFKFRVSHFEDALLLVMYFVVALALGQLTTRIRAQEVAERQREGRATALYLLGRELAEATTVDQIIQKVVDELSRSFHAAVAVLLPDARNRLQFQKASTLELGQKEQSVAAWVLEHRQSAGKFTGNLPTVDILFIPLESSNSVLGVLGLRLGQPAPPTIHQRNLLDALTRQIALALDRQRLSELSEKAKLLAESERLGKTLLDSMSHEIRTPVAAIRAAAIDLAELKSVSSPGAELIAEIQEAAERLNRLVGKVLDITRLESGHIKPLFNECEVNDIVNVAVAETEKDLAHHALTIDLAPDLPIIRTDFVFLQQALMNLLSNAALHTPAGTPVRLRVWKTQEALFLAVADRGPGIDPQSIGRVFDKFYRAPDAPTGGTGLGLSLVKGFVEALGGKVEAENRHDGGVEFTIALPLSQADRRASVSI